MRRFAAVSAALSVVAFAPLAAAQSGDCPPGGWFCEETPQDDPPTEPAADPAEPAEPPTDPAPAPEHRRRHRRPPPPAMPPPYVLEEAPPPPPPRKQPRIRRWGFQLRVESALMGAVSDGYGGEEGPATNAGMSGLGVSLRYRPVGHFALDFGGDFLAGRDWYGRPRSESAFSVNGFLFVNPRDAVQFYLFAGLGLAQAHVDRTEEQNAPRPYDSFSYFGGQMGLGLEFRVTRSISLDVDLAGFARSRTDSRAASEPEFTSPTTGQTTNSSGGGLLRGGVTFYW